ncbi:MAG: hypothetical protein QM689_08845 [Oscillospiraceae bacterium]
MKKFTEPTQTDNENPIENYINQKLKILTEEYQTDSITDFGAIFLLENENDNPIDMGFTEPLNQYKPEYIENVQIDSLQGKLYLEGCFVFSDGYGVIIIGEDCLFRKWF